jgi:hypothetical protein
MAAPTYTTDLLTLNLCENSGTFGEFTNMADGGSPDETDQDDVIQGSYLCSAQCSLKVGELQSIYADYGSGVTIPTDGALLMWNKFDAGGILAAYASGGVRIVIGASATNWDAWKAGGSDKTPNPYGGWFNYALNPLARTYDYRNSSGTGTTYQFAGMAISLTAEGPSKGQPFKLDAIRYGRGSIILEYGSVGDGYANFADAAAKNDANDAIDGYNRWGLFSASGGGYLWKGRMQLGTGSNAIEMEDSDVFILIDDTPNCTANFNTIEVNHVDTYIAWTNVIFKALGTQSPGRLIMNANADLNLDSCQFFDMGDFGFGGSSAEFLNCVWKGCGAINPAAGKLNGSQILSPTVDADTSAITWLAGSDPDGKLDNLTMSEGANAHHAIEFGISSPISVTIRGLDVGADFANTNEQNNSTFHVKRPTGTVTINCVSCSGNMTYKSAGATVVIVSDSVQVKVTAKTAAGVAIENARVMLKVADGAGPYEYQTSVTIIKLADQAIVSHDPNTYQVGDQVLIEGADQDEYNGVKVITGEDDTEYAYYVGSGATTPVTGTIVSTFVPISGLTDVNGEISDSRVYSSDQNVVGWARKSSESPYYKTGPITEKVDSADGLNTTAVLISDE